MFKHLPALIAVAVLAAGCATRPDKVAPAYVSRAPYVNLNCNQIRDELLQVAGRANRIASAQRKEHDKDVVIATVSLFVFWPGMLLTLGGDQREELSRLKGEHDTLRAVAAQKGCSYNETNDFEMLPQ